MRNQRTELGLGIWLIIGCGSAAQAQNITGYRYWFNDDVAAATVVDLAPTPVLDAELILSSEALPAGHHLATIQFRDADGLWGAPWTEHFVRRAPTVNAIEYWFNDEVDDAVTVAVTPEAAPLITAPLDANDLSVGYHTATVRTIDGIGERSVPYTVPFIRNGGEITGYEYWIDADIAERVSNPIGPSGAVELLADLPVPTTAGPHEFTIRFRDADGGWSVPLSTTFDYFVGFEELPGLSNFLLFPNPANAELGLRLEAAQPSDLDVSILDATGRTVIAASNWRVSGLVLRNWDISALSPGTYQVRIADGDHQVRIPFVKQ